jgi:site-specific DNA-cytosine methylase
MWALVEYAARVNPYVVAFESVQQAYSGGRDLMQALRTHLEELTGEAWNLYHVKHNAASVGGCAIRRRYFWVAARIPFGVEKYDLKAVPKLRDVISDLDGLDMTWEAQPYRRVYPSWWVNEHNLRSESGVVDGHRVDWCPYTRRAIDLLSAEDMAWGPREIISKVAKRYYEKTGDLPESWAASKEKLLASDFNMGYNQLTRWNPDKMARVITGGALTLVLHPWEDRPVSHREVARIMGFPDDWVIRPLRRVGGLRMTWGKGIAVQCGKWVGEWIRSSIEGSPGSDTGSTIGEREYLIDHTNEYRKFTDES